MAVQRLLIITDWFVLGGRCNMDLERGCGVIIDWISCGSGEGVWCYHRLDIIWIWRGCVVLS